MHIPLEDGGDLLVAEHIARAHDHCGHSPFAASLAAMVGEWMKAAFCTVPCDTRHAAFFERSGRRAFRRGFMGANATSHAHGAPQLGLYGISRNRTMSGMPPVGRRVTPDFGTGTWPAGTSKCAARTNVASMAVASTMAKEAPMQILGPAPKGRY